MNTKKIKIFGMEINLIPIIAEYNCLNCGLWKLAGDDDCQWWSYWSLNDVYSCKGKICPL